MMENWVHLSFLYLICLKNVYFVLNALSSGCICNSFLLYGGGTFLLLHYGNDLTIRHYYFRSKTLLLLCFGSANHEYNLIFQAAIFTPSAVTIIWGFYLL